jgi:uncharacterized protein (DUF1800 family)
MLEDLESDAAVRTAPQDAVSTPTLPQGPAQLALASLAATTLAACGGGGGDSGGTPAPVPTPPPAGTNPTAAESSRFLGQATFGPNQTEIDALANSSFDAWLTDQFAKPQTLHRPNVEAYLATLPADQQRGQLAFNWSLWKVLSTGPDLLRQRMALALSEIFVISLDSNLSNAYPRGPSEYMDMLGRNAFGNFRKLLEDVSLSPMMGIYLSHLRNQKEDAATGRVPDENYAREVMQLFSIGLYKLNADGTQQLDGGGKPLETYTNGDITGLAKVFTGFSWAGPDTSAMRFNGVAAARDPNREVLPMQAYSQYHSTAEKKFLGAVIPAGSADAMADLKAALDTLFNHPNVGPFIGKQLIQRLVTSNPSKAYVGRVAAAFANNGEGVRGDMQAVIKAILLDDEARKLTAVSAQSGKLREPIVRLLQWMRAFNAKSADGRFLFGTTSDPAQQLAQSPLRSPTVFNFFRPGYVPPNSKAGAQGLAVPEAQITNETSVAGYLNFMRGVIATGLGVAPTGGSKDIQADYSAQLALASDADKLVDNVNLLLTANSLAAANRTLIRDAVASVPIGTTAPDTDKLNRVKLAIYMTMAAPEYILQN